MKDHQLMIKGELYHLYAEMTLKSLADSYVEGRQQDGYKAEAVHYKDLWRVYIHPKLGTLETTLENEKILIDSDRFDAELIKILQNLNPINLIAIPGIYEILSEEFNNEIIENASQEKGV